MSLRLWSSLDGARDLRELRSRLLDNLLLLMALAATPGILISVLRARDIGWQTFMSVQIGILVVLWGLCLLRRRLGFGLRLGSFVVLSTVAALAATVQLGPAADARFFLVLATLVLGLLLSARAAWAFVGFSVLAVAALGVFAVQVGLPLRIDYPTYVRTPSAWFSITYTLAVYGGVIAYVAASLIRHLQHTAQLVERTSEVARIGTWELSAAGQLQWSALVRAIHGAEADPAGGIAGWLAHCDTAEARDRLGTAVAAAAQRGEPFSIELPASSRQGQALWLRITGLPDGRGGVQGLVQDITERRESERLKREFVAVVSHELRTPLTAISGSLDLIGSGALGEVPERMVPLIEVARRNGQRLRALIDDLLDVERLASGQLPLQLSPQRLREQLRLAVEVNAGYGAPRGVRLVAEPGAADTDVEVLVDPARLQQVLANLIANAIKFSPDGEVVSVALQRRDEAVRILVRDRGPGIPEAFRARLFERFAQADGSDTRQRGGTGLGLAISRALVERMGGAIGVDSTPGQGATFHVDLPVCRRDGG